MTGSGRQYAFTHLVGKLPLTTPTSAAWNVHGTGALGHEQPFDGPGKIDDNVRMFVAPELGSVVQEVSSSANDVIFFMTPLLVEGKQGIDHAP